MALIVLFLVPIVCGCQKPTPPPAAPSAPAIPAQLEEGKHMDFVLKSSAFTDGQAMPRDYTGDGADDSPPLTWGNVPPGTVELALIVEDPDAPNGDFVHWVAFGMSASMTALKQGVSPQEPGFVQGRNDFGHVGYRGPALPPGKVHHYHFRLMALDRATGLSPNADKGALRQAVRGHIIAEAKLSGTYQR